MDINQAWNLICEYVGTLESLSDTIDAYRDGDQVLDEAGLTVSELEQRETELGGRELVNEAWNVLYDIVKPMLKEPHTAPVEGRYDAI